MKQRGQFIEDDIARFRHEKEGQQELLEKEPLLAASPKQRARYMESDIARLRREKEEELTSAKENPSAARRSVKERASLLGPMLTDAEITKQRIRPLVNMMASQEQYSAQPAPSHGLIETVKEKAQEVMDYIHS